MKSRVPKFEGFKNMKEMRAMSGATRRRIARDIQSGVLPAHKFGQYWYFNVEDIPPYIETLKPQRYIPPSRDSERAAVL